MDSTAKRIAAVVREAISAATGLDIESLHHSTPLLETNMDSLTLVTVVSRIESAFATTFTADELAEILRARDIGEVAAGVARALGARGEHNWPELSRNASCVAKIESV